MSNSNKLYWLLQVCGWGLVGLAMLFFAHVYQAEISNGTLLARIAIVFTTGILTTHVLRIFIKWRGWLLQSIEKVIPKLVIAMVVTSMIYSAIILTEVDFFGLDSSGSHKLSFVNKLMGSTVDNGLFILPWVLIYYFYHFIEKSRKQQLDTLQLETLIKELELKTIKSHINPHFIFNSLNSIRALVVENPQRAREAITELSNILRSSMQADKSETVTLEKELNIVKDYLALENMRFEDRLRIEYNIDDDTLDQQVPPMMLQTLAENAIKHGISKQINGGIVRINSDFKGKFLELTVQNTGQLNGKANGEGFGLSSTTNRLNLLYGDNAKFEIKQIDPSLVEAKLLLPVDSN
ncbi:MAG TPA: histidine kinase [Chitinophagaceae bacterium]|jgi:sensor histidine kinase YesM|nr:histidine kinase [Chitinophagaceae bacterium]